MQKAVGDAREVNSLAVVPSDASLAGAARAALDSIGQLLLNAGVHVGVSTPLADPTPPREALERADSARLAHLAASTRPQAGLRVLLTPLPLHDGFFSRYHPKLRTVVVSTHEAAALGRREDSVFVAYELLLHGLRLLAPAYAPEQLLHDETRGCLFDLCSDKQDLWRKLHEGQLCRSCHARLPELGVDANLVEALLRAVIWKPI